MAVKKQPTTITKTEFSAIVEDSNKNFTTWIKTGRLPESCLTDDDRVYKLQAHEAWFKNKAVGNSFSSTAKNAVAVDKSGALAARLKIDPDLLMYLDYNTLRTFREFLSVELLRIEVEE